MSCKLLDYGGWMSARLCANAHPTPDRRAPRRERARHWARTRHQAEGPGAAIYAALRSEGMLERVTFGGDDGNADDSRRSTLPATAIP